MSNMNCPCKRTKCERHGNCAECRAYHHGKSSGISLTRCEKLKKKEEKRTDRQGKKKTIAMEVLYGVPSDIDSWMCLVNNVSWNFPGLETQEKLDEHRETVLRFMNKKQALCVKKGNEILGVILFSRGHNMICCLAVSPEYRRCGIAAKLLEKALGELNADKDITVSTFRENDEKGIAPRALYKKFGFVEDELIEEFGYPNQRFVLHPKEG